MPLVRGRRGVAASAVLALALVLTQLWFPYHYWDLALRLNERASFVCTCVCVPMTAVAFPSSRRDSAIFSLVASAWKSTTTTGVRRRA